MPKKRVVTTFKPMRFETVYGTTSTRERQQHAEEREAKRWFQTRLDNAHKMAVKYEPVAAERIADIAAQIKGKDMMIMKKDTTLTWSFGYDTINVVLTVEKIL